MVRSKAWGPIPNALDKHVGGKLRSAREAISETPETLARVMGASVADYERMERGEQRPPAESLHQAALYLRVPIAYFFIEFATAHAESPAGQDRPPKPTEGKC
jgi:transcriptional regulator with XRE-family HTH domain